MSWVQLTELFYWTLRKILSRRPSGPSTLNEDQIAERGARMARRDDREYREYLREEQRRQPGCPAREVVLDQRGQATSRPVPRGCRAAGPEYQRAAAARQQRHHRVDLAGGTSRASARRAVSCMC